MLSKFTVMCMNAKYKIQHVRKLLAILYEPHVFTLSKCLYFKIFVEYAFPFPKLKLLIIFFKVQKAQSRWRLREMFHLTYGFRTLG